VCLYTGNLLFIPLGLMLGYGFAWVGHFFIERNKPASFNYPLWSFRADWKMWALILAGRMNVEVERATANSLKPKLSPCHLRRPPIPKRVSQLSNCY
jgi:hypothetical protein